MGRGETREANYGSLRKNEDDVGKKPGEKRTFNGRAAARLRDGGLALTLKISGH